MRNNRFPLGSRHTTAASPKYNCATWRKCRVTNLRLAQRRARVGVLNALLPQDYYLTQRFTSPCPWATAKTQRAHVLIKIQTSPSMIGLRVNSANS